MPRKQEIRGELMKVGSSQRQIATELGLSEATVSKILAGKLGCAANAKGIRTRRAVLELVSAKTGIPLAEIEESTTAAAVAA